MNTPEKEIHELTQQLAAVKEELHVTQKTVRELMLLVLTMAADEGKPLPDHQLVQLHSLINAAEFKEKNFLVDQNDADYFPRAQKLMKSLAG